MKPIYHSPNRIVILFTVGIAFTMMSSCSQKIQFNQSTVVPAAEGTLKIKQDKNKNYSVDINVIRLAQPDRLQPARNGYVVWMDTQQNGTKNLGQLKSSSGLLSNTLKASLKTVTSFKPIKIYITAEDDPTVSYPVGQSVMTTQQFN